MKRSKSEKCHLKDRHPAKCRGKITECKMCHKPVCKVHKNIIMAMADNEKQLISVCKECIQTLAKQQTAAIRQTRKKTFQNMKKKYGGKVIQELGHSKRS